MLRSIAYWQTMKKWTRFVDSEMLCFITRRIHWDRN